MLTNIHVEHYKAFDKADIPIKPITILLGANSVGKSSIIQLLLAMEQTAMVNSESYTSCLKIYGSSVNLGSAENLFRKFDTKVPLVLSFTINDTGLYQKITNLYGELVEEMKRLGRRSPFRELDLKDSVSIFNKRSFLSYMKKIKSIDSRNEGYIRNSFGYYPLFGSFDLVFRQLFDADIPQLERFYYFLKGLRSLSVHAFVFDFSIRRKDRSTLVIEGLSIRCGNKTILSFEMNGDVIQIGSSFVDFDDLETKDIRDKIVKNSTIFACFGTNKQFDESLSEKCVVAGTVIYIGRLLMSSLQDTFKAYKINHVSPLRAHPKRYYMLDKANVTYSLDTLDGDAMAEVLKEKKVIKNRVNKWLDNFKLSVDVEELKEAIHNLKVKQNELSLDITDVGFGISQVLPTLIQGFLSRKDSLTMIEQPEIHLHPKMQADLADLFIDMVKGNNEKVVIIETHSEYLLRRLRRRISEGKIAADKVSICSFHPQSQEMGAVIEHLDIAEKGFFKWPENFYDGELENDITEFIKNQA